MNVWIVNPYDNLPAEGCRPQRYWLMARAFVRGGHQVVYWTSDFSHATKRARAVGDPGRVFSAEGIRVVMVPTLPYQKNVCLARVRSHRKLAFDFEREARREIADTRPDVVIASAPPLGLCRAAQRLAQEIGALFVADVQDAWPETFERILPRFVWSILGWRQVARSIYCEADGVSAVARRYLDLAQSYGSDAPVHLSGHSVEMAPLSVRPPVHSHLRLVYIGNMSLSYDLMTVIEAVRDLDEVTLDIAGSGPEYERLVKAGKSDRIRFHGYLGESDLANLLANSDVGIIPMFPESCVGVPGKLADYAKAGLRVFESLGGECQKLVEGFGVGCHYSPRDVSGLRAVIKKTIKAESLSEDRVCAFRECFDARSVMARYAEWIDGLVRCRKDHGTTRGPHHDPLRRVER